MHKNVVIAALLIFLAGCAPVDSPAWLIRQPQEVVAGYTDYSLCWTLYLNKHDPRAHRVREEIMRRGLASKAALDKAERGIVWTGENGCLWLVAWGRPDSWGRCGRMVKSDGVAMAWYDHDCSDGYEAVVTLEAPGDIQQNIAKWRVLRVTRYMWP